VSLQIVFLKQRMEFAPQLAALHAAEWRHLYAHWDESVGLAEFNEQAGDGSIPTTLIALDGDRLVGSVSVVNNDLPGWEHLNPWLASLYVLDGFRQGGVASRLVEEACRTLQQNGIRRAYLFTETSGAFFGRRGWRFVAKTEANGHPVEVYAIAVSS
jgi:GNAT superfamily N-acetyltransferase